MDQNAAKNSFFLFFWLKQAVSDVIEFYVLIFTYQQLLH